MFHFIHQIVCVLFATVYLINNITGGNSLPEKPFVWVIVIQMWIEKKSLENSRMSLVKILHIHVTQTLKHFIWQVIEIKICTYMHNICASEETQETLWGTCSHTVKGLSHLWIQFSGIVFCGVIISVKPTPATTTGSSNKTIFLPVFIMSPMVLITMPSSWQFLVCCNIADPGDPHSPASMIFIMVSFSPISNRMFICCLAEWADLSSWIFFLQLLNLFVHVFMLLTHGLHAGHILHFYLL